MNHGIISYVCRMKLIKFILAALLTSACLPIIQTDWPEGSVEKMTFTKVEIIQAPSGPHVYGNISLDLSNETGDILHLTIPSLTYYLEAGFYDIVTSAQMQGQCCAADDSTYTGGRLKVSRKNNIYSVRAELKNETGDIRAAFYEGEIPFEWEESHACTFEARCIEHHDQIIESEILGKEIQYTICLPENYDESKKYPVLYVLHGMNGDHNDWFSSGKINSSASWIEEETGVEMIIVSPYAMNSFYCDGIEDDMPYKTFFFDEFIPYIESRYSIRPERGSRAIAGISMGGYGALYYGILHPEMFCQIYACSPATYAGSTIPDLASTVKEADPFTLPDISIEIGTEDLLTLTMGPFIRQMDNKDIAYEYITRKGTHEWPFWRTCTPNVVSKAARAYEKARSRD